MREYSLQKDNHIYDVRVLEHSHIPNKAKQQDCERACEFLAIEALELHGTPLQNPNEGNEGTEDNEGNESSEGAAGDESDQSLEREKSSGSNDSVAMASTDGKYEQAILDAVKDYPRTDDPNFTYGTAGFRMIDGKLDYVLFAMGITAGLRSRKMHGKTIGIMITASHNKAEDNGVKLVDPEGEMLEQDWEKLATYLANARGPEQCQSSYITFIEKVKIDQNRPANVIFARDTRPSGSRLVQALVAGLKATGVNYTDYGLLTTPQLHYLVKATNTQNTANPYGEVSEEGYYKKISAAFKTAMESAKPNGPVTVDCANGVGAPQLKKMLKYLPNEGDGGITIRIVKDEIERPDLLNDKCGADYVKTQQCVPTKFDGKPYDRWASFDGDADRIVYYFNQEGPVFRLLDGDRIATLAANFIGELVQKSGLSERIKLAVVQTAYANGSSTKYIEQNLKLKVECTPTGVKHLHHVAARADIGVYFEANGHGTVLFSPQTLKRIHNHQPESPAQLEALTVLRAVTDLINQTVGDAISDLLLVEVILAQKDFTVKEWLATYTDLPNKLARVSVRDRTSFHTVEGTAERKLASPAGMQETIDRIVAKYKEGRCFVRASGTEEAVRVYAEAAEAYDCDDMINKVSEMILAHADLKR